MRTLFASGCALRKYKPSLVARMSSFLREKGIIDGDYEICCKSGRVVEPDSIIIACCPYCLKVFGAMPGVEAVSLWKVLLDSDFPLPDYAGKAMTIHDSCPARGRNSEELHDTSRELCRRMNITLVEPSSSGCCGGSIKDREQRVRTACVRADSLPLKDVVVYCTGCVRSFSVTSAKPHHLLDLVFSESTEGLTLI